MILVESPGVIESTVFETPTITTDVAQLDLSSTDYEGVPNGETVRWRVRVQADGEWSEWSDWARFSHVDKGAVTITTPGSVVAEYTPPVAWTTDFTQKAWRLLLYDANDPLEPIHDTGRTTGTDQDYSIPETDPDSGKALLVDGRDYILYVRAWDDLDREATPGDPTYSQAVITFNYADDPTPNQVTSLTGQQYGNTPYVDLTWVRAISGSPNTPDAWVILRDEVRVSGPINGPDLLVSGSTFTYRDKDAKPGDPHVYKVKPVVNGLTAGSPTVTVTPQPKGIWVLGSDVNDADIDVVLHGRDGLEFTMPDRGTTFTLPGVRTPVRITQGVNGYQGTVSGLINAGDGLSASVWRNRLLKLKRRGDRVTLIMGGDTFKAVISNINVSPLDIGGRTCQASFDFFQVGTVDWLDV